MTAGIDLALALVEEDLDRDIALAQRSSLSPRQFARAFTAEVGEPPGRYVDRVRLEAALPWPT